MYYLIQDHGRLPYMNDVSFWGEWVRKFPVLALMLLSGK